MSRMQIVCKDIVSGLNDGNAASILHAAYVGDPITLLCKGAVYSASQAKSGRLTIRKDKDVVAIATYQKKPPQWHVELLD